MHALIYSTSHIIASSTVTVAAHRVSNSWPWYIIRAAGFVAALLLFLLMISGIGQVTGYTYRFIEPIKAWTLHKALAIALCAAIAIHIGFLLIDHFVSFSLIQLFLPFANHYSNGTKVLGLPLAGIAVTLGILAMYGVIIVVLSSLGWINTKKDKWRLLHYLSYLIVFFVFLHALYAGSDLKYGTFRSGWVFFGILLGLAIVSRLRRIGTTKNDD